MKEDKVRGISLLREKDPSYRKRVERAMNTATPNAMNLIKKPEKMQRNAEYMYICGRTQYTPWFLDLLDIHVII